jgi:hypothetical protein
MVARRSALLSIFLLGCPFGDDGSDEGAAEGSSGMAMTSAGPSTGGTPGLVVTVSTGGQSAGASALVGEVQDLQPPPGDPWFELDDLPAEGFAAMAADAGALGSAEFELGRDDPHAVELRASGDAGAPGTGATALASVTFADFHVCARDEAAVAFRFTIECTGEASWTGNAGSASIALRRNLLTHCQTTSNVVIEMPWEYPDGNTFEVDAANGEVCERFEPAFLASAGGETIPDAQDDMGTGSVDGTIRIAVESVY